MHPLWQLVMYFCVHNCTSPSNDYVAVAWSNNNQAQLHTYISVPYWSPDVWLGLELLWDIQFGLPAILKNSIASYQSRVNNYVCMCHECIHMSGSGRGNPNIFRCASCANGWIPISKFLNPLLIPEYQLQLLYKAIFIQDFRGCGYILRSVSSQLWHLIIEIQYFFEPSAPPPPLEKWFEPW